MCIIIIMMLMFYSLHKEHVKKERHSEVRFERSKSNMYSSIVAHVDAQSVWCKCVDSFVLAK